MEYYNLCKTDYSNKIPSYSMNSEYKVDLNSCLEAMALDKKPEHKPGTLESMFSDKGRSLKASVNALLEEIKLREGINSYQIGKINEEILKQNTQLMQFENLKDSYPFNQTKDVSETKSQIESNVLELEREKRKESLECWRDLMFLKKYLMSSLKEYWELVKKLEVLEEDFTYQN